MIRNTDSDFNPTMAACEAFDKVINCVRTSNLNFSLQLSPFSANFSVKKTIVKDKAGLYITRQTSSDSVNQNLENIELLGKVNDLESIIKDLKLCLEKCELDCQNAHNTIKRLENELVIKKEKSRAEEYNLKDNNKHELEKKSLKISNLQEENKSLRAQTASLQVLQLQQDDQIRCLKRDLQNSKNAVKRLNKELNDDKVKHAKEIKQTVKNLKWTQFPMTGPILQGPVPHLMGPVP